jgi:hypothetical protein
MDGSAWLTDEEESSGGSSKGVSRDDTPVSRSEDRCQFPASNPQLAPLSIHVAEGASVGKIEVHNHASTHYHYDVRQRAASSSVSVTTRDGRTITESIGPGTHTIDVLPGCRGDIGSLPLPSEGGPALRQPANPFSVMKASQKLLQQQQKKVSRVRAPFAHVRVHE